MPSPTTALQRPDLGASMEQYDVMAARGGFIADKVAPAIDVAEPTANIGRIPLKALLFNRETKRGPGGGYARADYQFEHFSYATEEHGAEELVDDKLAKIYRRYFDAEQMALKRAQGVIMRNREKRLADALFNTTTWTGAALTTSITNEWDDFGNATPIDDVDAAVEKVFTGSGLAANGLIVNAKVFKNLTRCDQVIDRLMTLGLIQNKGEFENVSAAMLAAVLFPEVPDARIVIAGGIRNTVNPGQAATPGRIWDGEYAMVARLANTNDPHEPCVARSFNYSADGGVLEGLVETYREESKRSDVVRVRHETAEKVMYTEAAHLLQNITT